MNILHVIDSEGFYGAETVLVHLVVEQKKRGEQATILNMRSCLETEASLEAEAHKQGLNFHAIQLHPGLDIKGAIKIIRYALDNNFDVIHCHGYKADIHLGLMPKLIRKLPVVATLHGWCSTKKYTKLWLFEQIDLFSLSLVDAVVVVHQAMTTHPYLRNQRRKIQVVNNGIPKLDFETSPLDSDIKRFCSEGVVLGAIGRLSKEKGFDNLIEAVNLIRKKGMAARLLIIGEGPEHENLIEKIRKYDLEEHVFLAGYRQSAKNYLRLFNVFVMPSSTEGLPITLLEAMQARVPVVATAVGGIPYVLKHGKAGFLVPKQSVEKLKDSICECIKEKTIVEKMIDVASEQVLNNYSSEAMFQLYNKIYRSIAANGKSIS